MPTQTNTDTMWSLSVVKSHLKATTPDYDAQIARLADGVSARIQNGINRQIVTKSGLAEYLNIGHRTARLQLRTYPVVSVQTLEYRFTLLGTWVPVDASHFELDQQHGHVYLLMGAAPFASANGVSFSFPVGPRSVHVVYTAGYDAQDGPNLPIDLYNLGLDWVKFLYDRWRNDLIMTSSVSEAGRSISVPSAFPKDVREAIDQYRKIRL